ncbi:MAG: zinc ribbon domain-containing protein [Clostridiales bacterium]|nr:zinc ribbon domain-containing protein [Clostridiales bacterium]
MALVKCPECGKLNVSDTAESCPECGYGIKAHFEKIKMEEIRLESEKQAEIQSSEFEDEQQAEIQSQKFETEQQGEFEENKNNAVKSEKLHKLNKKKKILLCGISVVIVLGIILTVVISVKNSFSTDEKIALRVVEKYKNMLKDPDSLILRSDVVVIKTYSSDDGTHTYCFFTASGNNSYGASITSTCCFMDGTYICDTGDFPDNDELFEMDTEEAIKYTTIRLRLAEWNLYGETLSDESDEVYASYAVDANKIARKIGATANT